MKFKDCLKYMVVSLLVLLVIVELCMFFYLRSANRNLRHNCEKSDVFNCKFSVFDTYCRYCSEELTDDNVIDELYGYCEVCKKDMLDGYFCSECGCDIRNVNLNIKDTRFKSLKRLQEIRLWGIVNLYCIVVLLMSKVVIYYIFNYKYNPRIEEDKNSDL